LRTGQQAAFIGTRSGETLDSIYIRKTGDKMKNSEAKNLIGCCGLYCGLCNKYQSKAPSRCIGCKLGEQHSWCSIWNCCVKKHGFMVCTECKELFSCKIFLKRKVMEWIPAAGSLKQIKDDGLNGWLKEQKERQALLEELLRNYNDGRSMSFYCKAGSGMPIHSIHRAIKEAKDRLAHDKIEKSDMKSKAMILRAALDNRKDRTDG
jgi:hypothetical protein